MFGRLISFGGADPARRDEAVETIRATVIPMLRRFDGYGGYIALYDGEAGRAKAIILWETREAADAAEAELEARRRHIAGSVGLTIDSVELYEVPVFELEGAATRA
jgi:hypothetical protein